MYRNVGLRITRRRLVYLVHADLSDLLCHTGRRRISYSLKRVAETGIIWDWRTESYDQTLDNIVTLQFALTLHRYGICNIYFFTYKAMELYNSTIKCNGILL